MCSITGYANFRKQQGADSVLLNTMGHTLAHRGPDQKGIYLGKGFGFQHNRLAIIDVANGLQPMTADYHGYQYVIVYNGELYNTAELRKELEAAGIQFKTQCDTEVVLYSYIVWGAACSSKFNGIFAFAIYDESKRHLYLSRDHFGVKPLFYTKVDDTFIFASEIKALLKYPGVTPQIDQQGLWKLLFLNPVRPQETAIFKDIFELPPANHGTYSLNGLKISPYWSLEAHENGDSEKTIVETTRELVLDAVKRQLVSDVPLCTFLSGGLDSSIITALAAQKQREKGEILSTYSFEYEGNKKHFSSNKFQPSSDDDYAQYLANQLETNHTILTANSEEVVSLLGDAVTFRDLPGMADIDSSLLYYCRKVKENHTVALSGECSDEVFGGYPWFYRPEMLNSGYFPWIHDPLVRVNLFKQEIARPEKGLDYTREVYRNSVNACPLHSSDSLEMKNSRIASWLSINFFMSSLLERKDRMSMACGLEVRVPFADHRLVQYIFNVPWSIKYRNQTEKALLREAMKDYLPENIINRKKSPYPKTRNPNYERIVTDLFLHKFRKKDSILNQLLSKDAVFEALYGPDRTWFGQLMSRPQLIGWLIQLDYWFENYKVELVL